MNEPEEPAGPDPDSGLAGESDGGIDDAITIPEFGSFPEVDEREQLTDAVEAQAEVDRFGPTSEDAHPVIRHPALDRLRSFCLMLPETTEVSPFGQPTFRVAAKAYATFELVDDQASVLFKADPARQAVLVAGDAFARDPDTGHHGWTLARLSADVDWDELDELIIASYRLVAPPEHVAQLDALLG